MIILGNPKNIDNYIHFNFDKSRELHLNGIIPVYKNKDGMWFQKVDIINGGDK